MKYLEFVLLCIKTVVGSFMIAVAIWSIPYVLLDVHQTQERDRVMSEAWHRINNEDDHEAWKFLVETGVPTFVFADWRKFCVDHSAANLAESLSGTNYMIQCKSAEDSAFERARSGNYSVTAELEVPLGYFTYRSIK